MAFGDGLTRSNRERAEELGLFQNLDGEPVTLGGTLSALGSGFLSGFTGFNIGDDPDNAVEGIARSLGSVAGFLGLIPTGGSGLVARVGASSLGRAIGLGRFAGKAAKGSKLGFTPIGSIPLFFADKVIDVARGSAKLKAATSASSILSKPIVRDRIVEGARFGLASGFSATGHGEDFRGILTATGLGVVDGAGFHWLNTKLRQDWLKGLQGPNKDRYEMAARGLTNAIWSGVPSTFAGAPLESQVFEYALGFMFGVHDPPYEVRKANEFMQRKNAFDLAHIERVPGFEDLDDVVKEELFKQRDLHFGKHINQEGDTEASGVISKAITDLFKEEQQSSFNDSRSKGFGEEVSFEKAVDDAIKSVGIRTFEVQQSQNWQSLGPIFRSEHFRENRPELWIGDNPDSPGSAVSYNKDRNRIIIDDALLERDFQNSSANSKAEFLSREVLTQYLSKTSPDADVNKLVDAEIEKFGLNNLKVVDGDANNNTKVVEDTTHPTALKEEPFKRRLSIDEVGPLAQDIEPLESVRRSSVSGTDLLNSKSPVDQAREDHELSALIANPLENFNQSLSRFVPDIDSNESRNVVFGAFAKEGATWESAIKDVEKFITSKDADVAESGATFDITKQKELTQDLRRAWKQFKHNQGIRQGHYSGGQFKLYGENGLGRVDGSGKAISKAKTKTHLQKSLENDLSTFVIEKAESREGGRTRVAKIFDEADNPNFDPIRYLEDSYRSGTPFFMGTKDKGRAQHTEGFLFDKEDAPRLFGEKLSAIARVEAEHGKGKGLGVEESINRLISEATEAGMSREAFEGLMLNNIMVLEKMNGGIKFEDMIRMNKTGEGKFIMAPHKLNKRGSLFDDGGVPADPAFYNDKLQEQGGFRAIVVNGKFFDGAGIKPIELPGIGRAEHHMDGVVFMEQDAFQSMLSDIGGDDGAGVIKGSTVFSTEGEGMFLGKMAIFRASEEIQSEMRRLGVDQIFMDSATKQRGKREELFAYRQKDGKLQITRGKDRNGAPLKNLPSFVVPFDGMRMNMSVGEKVHKALSDQRAPSQLHANLTDQAVRDHWIKNYVEPSARGDEAQNKLYNTLKNTYDDKSAEGLNWDKVGIKEISALYTGIRPDGSLDPVMADDKLFASMMNHVMRKTIEDADNDDFFTDEGGLEAEDVQLLQEFTSSADRIMKLWDLTPATISHPWVKPFADAAMRNFLMKRVMRPKIPYSGKVIAGPADPYLRSKLDIKPGHVYLDESWKDKKIRWLNGTETTLGRAYDDLNNGKHGPSVREEMERLLSFATIRVPADSISGTRILSLGGFTGRRGAGGTVHNEDMIYLGGMDLDIDSFFIFQDIDNSGGSRNTPIADHINAHRHQFNEAQNPNRPIIDSKPEKNDADYVEVLRDFEEHPIAMMDPRLLMNSQVGAYRGNQLIGIAAVTGRRGSSWFSEAQAGNKDALELIISGAMRKEISEELGIKNVESIRLAPADSKDEFEAVRREAMNRAVDAGDFAGFKQNKFSLGPFITRNLVKAVEIKYKENGKTKVRRVKLTPERAEMFNPSKTKFWKDMAKADTFAKGKNYGDQFSAEDAWKAIQNKINADIGEVPDRFNSDDLFSIDEVAKLFTKEVRERSGRDDITEAVIEKAMKGARSEEGSYTLSQTMQNLKKLRPTLNAPNTHYQALGFLADAPFTNTSNDMRYINEDGYRALVESFNKVYNEDTLEAALARKMISRLELTVSEEPGLDPWRVQGDIHDMVSVRMAYDASLDALQNGVDIRRLNEIAELAEDYKLQHEAAINCG